MTRNELVRRLAEIGARFLTDGPGQGDRNGYRARAIALEVVFALVAETPDAALDRVIERVEWTLEQDEARGR